MTQAETPAASPLAAMVRDTPTDYWNDSCAVEELQYAVARGATGATSNPTIVLEVLRKEKARWLPRLAELIAGNPSWTEVDLTWALVEEMAVSGAAVLEPVFRAAGGRKGRLSLQTDPANYRNADRMLEQGLRFAGLAPNMQVKFPATSAGLQALERATAAGVNINATVSFTVAQALAVGEAVERGLAARAASGGDVSAMSPVCTMMIGRLDDWMRVLVGTGRRGRSTPTRSTGPASRPSSGPSGSTGSGATGRGCSRRPTATGCTGRSWSAATSC